MKILFSLFIFFILSISNLYSEQICLAPSGCSIDMETGDCPNCKWIEDEPKKISTAPIIKKTITRTFETILENPKSKICRKYWKCIVPPCEDMMGEGDCLVKE